MLELQGPLKPERYIVLDVSWDTAFGGPRTTTRMSIKAVRLNIKFTSRELKGAVYIVKTLVSSGGRFSYNPDTKRTR